MRAYNYSFVKSHYNEDTKETIATINTDLGHFTGRAKCHPDEEHPSYIFGGRIAEGRALEKYLRSERRVAKLQQKAIQDLYNAVACMNGFDEDNMYASKMRRALYEKAAEINHIDKLIAQLKQRMAFLCTERDVLLKSDLFNKHPKS